jgi:hypothetical protein
MALKTSDVLRKAGDVLRERGWCQFRPRSSDGASCAYGAIFDGANEQTADYDAGTNALRSVVFDEMISIWNDTPGRTAAEVMHALDAAYVLALQEEGIEPGDVL